MTTHLNQNTNIYSRGLHHDQTDGNAASHNWIWDLKSGWRPYSPKNLRAYKLRLVLVVFLSLFLFILYTINSNFVWASSNLDQGHQLSGPYEAELISVHDGDTYKFKVMIWPGTSIEAVVRLRGVDTMELRSKCPDKKRLAFAAKKFAYQKLLQSPVKLTQISKGKYFGRVIARVTLTNGDDLGDLLLSHGLAQPYSANHKKRNASCSVT